MRPRIAVLGGGLAGITAALQANRAGFEVVLVEARPKLGGLTHSFARDGVMVDNGQHVFLRCCTRYRALLARLGVEHLANLQSRLDVPIRRPGVTRPDRLRRTALPAPLHLGNALLAYGPLPRPMRVRAVLAALALRGVDVDDPATDRRSFAEWLHVHGQDDAAIRALWDVVGVATLNARAEDASLALAAHVFQQGLLTDRAAADIGWSRVPLQQLHGDAAERALTARGARVRCGVRATGLTRVDEEWVIELRKGTDAVPALHADAVVVALPPRGTEELLPPTATPLPAGWSDRLGSAPIVNAHLRYDRPVLDIPFVAGLDSPVQWVFDRSGAAGLPPGRYVAISLSAAHAFIDVPTGKLREQLVPALAGLLPAARGAVVEDFFVTREREATFAPGPGVRAHRPGPRTPAPHLVLAGAHTDTGWPATMESAVRSGEAAIEALGPLTAIPARAPRVERELA